MVMGLVGAGCLNLRGGVRPTSGLLIRLFSIIGPWVFVAGPPSLIRAVPEGYKGFVIEGILIPLCVLALASRPKRRKRKAVLRWNPRLGCVLPEGWRRLATA